MPHSYEFKHRLGLSTFALLFMHVQVATRFLSHCPAFYWFCGHLLSHYFSSVAVSSSSIPSSPPSSSSSRATQPRIISDSSSGSAGSSKLMSVTMSAPRWTTSLSSPAALASAAAASPNTKLRLSSSTVRAPQPMSVGSASLLQHVTALSSAPGRLWSRFRSSTTTTTFSSAPSVAPLNPELSAVDALVAVCNTFQVALPWNPPQHQHRQTWQHRLSVYLVFHAVCYTLVGILMFVNFLPWT